MGEAEEPATPADVTLGGRVFKVLNFDARTVAQDHYLMKWLRATGVDKCLPGSEEDEPTEAYLIRVQICLLDSGLVPELLGGYLIPEDTQWTLAVAEKTSSFIKALDTQEDRETVTDFAMRLVFSFFLHGLDFLKRFQKSSRTSASLKMQSGMTQH